jgi:hypothetical protein
LFGASFRFLRGTVSDDYGLAGFEGEGAEASVGGSGSGAGLAVVGEGEILDEHARQEVGSA